MKTQYFADYDAWIKKAEPKEPIDQKAYVKGCILVGILSPIGKQIPSQISGVVNDFLKDQPESKISSKEKLELVNKLTLDIFQCLKDNQISKYSDQLTPDPMIIAYIDQNKITKLLTEECTINVALPNLVTFLLKKEDIVAEDLTEGQIKKSGRNYHIRRV